MKTRLLLLALVSAASLGAQTLELTIDEIKQTYDRNKDGKLDQHELRVLLLHLQTVPIRDIDSGNPANAGTGPNAVPDGNIHPEEARAGLAKPQFLADSLERTIDIELPGATRDVESLHRVIYGEATAAPSGIAGWILRRDINVTVTTAKNAKGGEPALVQYARDNKADTEIWTYRGALMRPYFWKPKERPTPGKASLTDFGFIPGVSFDRVTGSAARSAHVLGFHAGALAAFQGGAFDRQEIRFNTTYALDRRRSSEVAEAEAQWRPIKLRYGFETYRSIVLNSPLQYRLTGYARVRTGQVIDAGTNPKLNDRSDYLRVGGKGKIELRLIEPAALKNLSVSGSYDYDSGVSGSPQKSDAVEVALKAELDRTGHLSAEVVYEKGEVTIVKEATETLRMGIGLKF